ncbi:GTPase domain-containing protein [Photobacterium atrarenae]|uniref:GTPase domain-containing protein n=1 Tax=Photobacterium atrarenae TaxID=865757 RepID=A0ABY5GMG0_9GAMM|nr:GTPase domain-containing protein [Photobacterium atrarenae]UTV30514.1 GTPase domain-containing protein [Photobacterium atrarenae]
MNLHKINQLVSKHCPEKEEVVTQLEAAMAVDSACPNVVVYGVYNSGKSSLLNSLTNHVTDEFFRTRDVPETRENKHFEYQGIRYIDTPGLDVNIQDTRAAKLGTVQADIILLVHRLSAGSLQQKDLEALASIGRTHARPENIFVVLTEAETADENQAVIAEITQQLQQVISPNITPFLVANPVFCKGMREEKPALVQFSGIPALQAQLQQTANQIAPELAAERAKKVQAMVEELQAAVAEQQTLLQARLAIEEAKEHQHKVVFVERVKAFQQALQTQLNDIESV